MMWWSIWWVWLAFALVMGILEMLIPAYIFLGFAIGAALTGIGLAAGLLTSVSFAWLLVIFAVLSLLGYIGVRMAFGAPGGSVKVWHKDINDN